MWLPCTSTLAIEHQNQKCDHIWARENDEGGNGEKKLDPIENEGCGSADQRGSERGSLKATQRGETQRALYEQNENRAMRLSQRPVFLFCLILDSALKANPHRDLLHVFSVARSLFFLSISSTLTIPIFFVFFVDCYFFLRRVACFSSFRFLTQCASAKVTRRQIVKNSV